MKSLPNILSCLRIILSVTLLFLCQSSFLFFVVYLLCGLSDVVDGYLARLLNAETILGSKLDSLGDFVFYIVWVFVMVRMASNEIMFQLGLCFMTILIMRLGNLLVTKMKFRQWSIIHTFGNKGTGVFLFLFLPAVIILGNISSWTIFILFAVAMLATVEETILLWRLTAYNPNIKSLLFWKDNVDYSNENHL
ncbi:CDP-alcohol phosphatidyltransferase [Robertmurraya siralis]|uniref:CDP-alcohol phosphatidyltransferase n=1 Tax=Robertmurraya siralis TaxID=77777 RepID=A0A919WGR5_9BACI|nr:CDP-alcohol phosphatidyltransferase family protein [Robertmurraya siralis]GIN61411.1 CDP-alcohol phosphatidyltransferase [Robertmurraya siralis]